MLWAATVGLTRPVRECIDAAAATGLANMSIHGDRLLQHAAGRADQRAIAAYAVERGVSVALVDGVMAWFALDGPIARVARDDAAMAATTSTLDEALKLADALGARALNVLGRFVDPAADVDTVAAAFAGACDRAADCGCRLLLEFVPYYPGIPDLAAAWEILRRADRPNSGLVFDTWHFFRGAPDLALLAQIPGRWIQAVQFSDAAAQVDRSLAHESIHSRLLPGDGVFDLGAVVRVLRRADALTWVGPEVIADRMAALPAAEAAATCVASVDRLLAETPS